MHHRWGSTSVEVCIQRDLYPQGVGQTSPLPKIHGILQDTANKRAVRILLECVLVLDSSLWKMQEIQDDSTNEKEGNDKKPSERE